MHRHYIEQSCVCVRVCAREIVTSFSHTRTVYSGNYFLHVFFAFAHFNKETWSLRLITTTSVERHPNGGGLMMWSSAMHDGCNNIL